MLQFGYARHLGLSDELFNSLGELPGTQDMSALKYRAQALSAWRVLLRCAWSTHATCLRA